MESLVYNIDARSVPRFKNKRIIVRSFDPDEIDRQLSGMDLDDVDHVQLLSPAIPSEKIENLSRWQNQLPVDLYLGDPKHEYPLLYNFAKLTGRHPIRVTVKVTSGFSKAVKLAAALNFAVKLEVDCPDPDELNEMAAVLELYLHRPTVSQPIEYFHCLFLSLYRREAADLWTILEDDPERFRFVADNGTEMPVARKVFPAACRNCEFSAFCKGYFKRSHSDYDCGGVISLFRTLAAAAAELRENVAASPVPTV